MLYQHLLRPLLYRMDPEKAHHLAFGALRGTAAVPGGEALLRLALTYALFQFGFFVPLHHLAPFAELDAGPAGGGPRFLSWLSIEVRRSVRRAI